MKWWYSSLIIVPVGLAIGAYFTGGVNVPVNVTDILSSDSQVQNRQSDGGKKPVEKTVPQEVPELWQKHRLRPLTEREEGAKIQDLPKGIVGFSMCSVASLSGRRGKTSPLEIHKHHDGIVYYVGYASDLHIDKYLARDKNFHLYLYPHSSETAPSLFEIPVDFVSKCESQPSGDGHRFDLFVTDIPLLQS